MSQIRPSSRALAVKAFEGGIPNALDLTVLRVTDGHAHHFSLQQNYRFEQAIRPSVFREGYGNSIQNIS